MRFPVRRSRPADDYGEEIAAHLAMETDRLVRLGLSPADATLAARRAFGNPTLAKERYRDSRPWVGLEQFQREVATAVRGLRRNPAFTTVAVLSLAVAIGASTAVFSVIDALFLRPLPVRSPSSLVNFREHFTTSFRDLDLFATEEYLRFRDLTTQFQDVATVAMMDRSNISVSGVGGGLDAGHARVALVSGNYFHMYGVAAERGRLIGPDDDRVPSGQPVVVIGHDYWMRRMGGTDDALDRTITLNHTVYRIIGILDRRFSGDWIGRPIDIWMPMMMQAEVMPDAPGYLRERHTWPSAWARVVGRLAPGVTRESALAEVALVHARMVREWEGQSPDAQQLQFDAARRLSLEPGARGYSPQRESLGRALGVLVALIALVLVVACTNVAGLLLARSVTREREVALRLALGAGASRVARQFLVESVLLACLGGALGLLLAGWGSKALAGEIAAGPVKMDWGSSSWLSFDVALGARAIGFAMVIGIVAGLMFGLVPAMRAAGLSAGVGLTSGTRGATASLTTRTKRLLQCLVISQVALSLVALVAAGLLVRTLDNLRSQDFGFEKERVLLAWTQAGATGRSPKQLRELYRITQQRLALLPGVEAVGITNHGSLDGAEPIDSGVDRVRIPGQTLPTRGLAGWRTFLTPGYFRAMGIPIVRGRDFTAFDTDSTPRVIIVSQAFARHYFGRVNPVGHTVHLGWEPGDSLTRIVGVVGDFVNGSPRERGRAIGFSYMPYQDRESGRRLTSMAIAVRTFGPPTALAGPMQRELHAIDPTLPVLRIDTVDQQLDDVLTQDRLLAALATFFGVVAVFLACLGLYGLVAFRTARRMSEFGIRVALGAPSTRVVSMVLAEGAGLTLAGVALGLPLVLVVNGLMSTRLFGIGASDPLMIGAGAIAMLAVTSIAAYLPARRASRADPMIALRSE